MNAHRKTLLPLYIKGLISGKYTLQQASDSTGYNRNYLCRLKQRYLSEGSACFESRRVYGAPHNKLPDSIRAKVAAIYCRDFQDVNFAYFGEILDEVYGIKLSKPTIRSILIEYGQESPRARKPKRQVKKCRHARLRRECEGDLIQIDGTPYAWFSRFGDKKRYCLSGAIDDATGKLTGLYITESECLYGYLEILRQTCKTYGVPREIYSDRAAIFCVTPKQKRGSKELDRWEQLAVLHDERTQWQRILNELYINQILAWSPEAKGRIERAWQTIQGQLPIWLWLHGARTVDQANAILQEYMDQFNLKYGREPAVDDPFWIDAPENLDDILQCKIPRYTDKAGGFKFHSYHFVLESPRCCHVHFDLCISERGIAGCYDGKYYPVRCLDQPLAGLGEKMPKVLEDLIYRYLFAYAKEISA